MNKYEQAERLALSACFEVSVIFTCDKCSESRQEKETSMHSIAIRAVKEGWQVNNLFEVRCPSCAEKLR